MRGRDYCPSGLQWFALRPVGQSVIGTRLLVVKLGAVGEPRLKQSVAGGVGSKALQLTATTFHLATRALIRPHSLQHTRAFGNARNPQSMLLEATRR